MRLPLAFALAIASAMVAGCDSNPGGPTFPTVPAGTKLPPANTAPELDTPRSKGAPLPAPIETG